MPSTATLLVIALLGGLIHAAVTVKWYRPLGDVPAPEVPVLEAVLFGGTFSALYFLLGAVLRSIAAWRPPLTEYLLLGISVAGFAITVAFLTGRVGASRRFVEQVMSALLAAMLWVLPLLVLIL